MTLHKEFWGLLFIGFIAVVFLSTDPHNRIKRACSPISWVGNVVTSLTALVMPQHQERVDGWFDNLDYSCQYMTWRLFYQEDYNKWVESQKQASQPAGVAPITKGKVVSSSPLAVPPASAPAQTLPSN